MGVGNKQKPNEYQFLLFSRLGLLHRYYISLSIREVREF